MSGARPLLPPGFLSRLAAFDLAARRPVGVLPGGAHLGGRPGAGTLFRDHRPYDPGDDLRYVDWNAFARHEVLHTKRFEVEEAARVVLLLDASGSMAAGTGERLRAAARGLAVLGAVALGRGDPVLFLPVPGGRPRRFRGRARLPALLEAMGEVRGGGPTDLGAAFREGLAPVRGRALAIVASDFLDPRGACAGIDLLRRRGWEVRALQPVAPSDLEPPPEGPVILVDAETGEERRIDCTPAERERLRAAAAERLRRFRASLRARGVAWASLPTGEEDPGALLSALRRGRVLS